MSRRQRSSHTRSYSHPAPLPRESVGIQVALDGGSYPNPQASKARPCFLAFLLPYFQDYTPSTIMSDSLHQCLIPDLTSVLIQVSKLRLPWTSCRFVWMPRHSFLPCTPLADSSPETPQNPVHSILAERIRESAGLKLHSVP